MSLEHRVCLVTGAGGKHGIGRAIALRLARSGADVAVTDVRRASQTIPEEDAASGWKGIESVREEIEASGRRARAFTCDLRNEEEVAALIQSVISCFGSLHILVNNARAELGRAQVPVAELEAREWDETMAVNARGALLCCKHAIPHLIRHPGESRIINIASDSAKRARPRSAAYSASKFALLAITQALAFELAPQHVTVNAVCAGPTDTHRVKLSEQQQAEREGVPLSVVRERNLAAMAKGIPLGRVAAPDDVAALVGFLASVEAGYITAQALNVDGGMHVY